MPLKMTKKIETMAKNMRKNILDMSLEAGSQSAHFGGGLSIVDITATLYGAIMNYDPKNPEWEDRDRFILSKGHGVFGYYTALSEIGLITKDELLTFEQSNSFLLGHQVMNRRKGIEFTNGSLGMGLSVGIGVALAAKKKQKSYRVFVLMGDGECNEGSIWEGAMSAPHFKLDNIVGIVDKNNFQQTGSTVEILNTQNLGNKWKSFGWDVVEVDGHNVTELLKILSAKNTKDKPKLIIANTIKGKGFSFSENTNEWHHNILTKSQYDKAIAELNNKNEN